MEASVTAKAHRYDAEGGCLSRCGVAECDPRKNEAVLPAGGTRELVQCAVGDKVSDVYAIDTRQRN